MASSWAKPKIAKLKRMRRAWARPLSMKSGAQGNREVIKQYQDTVKGLGIEIAEVRFPNVAPGRKEMIDRINTIGDPLREIYTDIKDPLFVTILSNSRQRVRLFWNSSMNKFIIQWVHWEKGFVWISITYPVSARAKSAWDTGRVIWSKKIELP